MKFERCKKENQQVKSRKTKAESQRYKCKYCGKVYKPKQKGMRYIKEIKKKFYM